MTDVRTETGFFWSLVLQILITPYTLVMVLAGKKRLSELFNPFYEIVRFVFEPRFTILMIIANISIFVLSRAWSEETLNSLAAFPSDLLELNFGTLITSGFLHVNVMHLFGNMLALFIFGRVVERRLGFLRAAFVYFGAMIISNLFSSVVHLIVLKDNIGGIGASGAIMGLIATAMLIDPFYLTYELLVPLPVMVVSWITIYADITGIINPMADGIGHFAHIGGFLSIGLVIFFMGIEEKERLRNGLLINIVSIVFAVILLLTVKNPFGMQIP